MTDEIGMETTSPDAPSADESLFGDTQDDAAAAVIEQEGTEGDAEQTQQDPEAAGEPANEGDANGTEDLKVVVSIKGGRATIGVQQPSSDPHIETFDDLDESGLTQEVSAVIERARARWEEAPKHPAYERPAPPARRQRRRQQGAAQNVPAEEAEEAAQAQQQTLRLF